MFFWMFTFTVEHTLQRTPNMLFWLGRWVEAVFGLVWAVVSVQHGAAAMTECGLIPALLNVVQLNMDGQVLLNIIQY